jgi:hypothetical protein
LTGNAFLLFLLLQLPFFLLYPFTLCLGGFFGFNSFPFGLFFRIPSLLFLPLLPQLLLY